MERMRYADFRAQGLFVGSGVVEAGCKNIIAARMKKSGAKWSVRGANDIIACVAARVITLRRLLAQRASA